MFEKQKSQEIRLKEFYDANKSDRLNKNKERYDRVTLDKQLTRDMHSDRLQRAAEVEEHMMQRLNNTLTEQNMAVEELRAAINQTKIQKRDRLELEMPVNDGVRNLRNRTTLK